MNKICCRRCVVVVQRCSMPLNIWAPCRDVVATKTIISAAAAVSQVSEKLAKIFNKMQLLLQQLKVILLQVNFVDVFKILLELDEKASGKVILGKVILLQLVTVAFPLSSAKCGSKCMFQHVATCSSCISCLCYCCCAVCCYDLNICQTAVKHYFCFCCWWKCCFHGC